MESMHGWLGPLAELASAIAAFLAVMLAINGERRASRRFEQQLDDGRREADRQKEIATANIRPLISTGVSDLPSDLGVSLSNYGAGVAIITRIVFRRSGGDYRNNMAELIQSSKHLKFERGIMFVQSEYFLRPGDSLPVISLKAKSRNSEMEAVDEWVSESEGLEILVEYQDMLKNQQPTYHRIIKRGEIGGDSSGNRIPLSP